MIESTFDVTGWDESPVDDTQPKITQTSVTKSFAGDLEGSSQMNYVMVYDDDGSAGLVALERIDATIGDRSGCILLRHVGQFADGAATADIEVLPEFGTGDFAGVSGTGTMRADPSGTMSLDLDG